MNTHGGNLSEAYIIGMTHMREGIEQTYRWFVQQVEGGGVLTTRNFDWPYTGPHLVEGQLAERGGQEPKLHRVTSTHR